ncbi:MAG: imidazole glycerol phosphate synthase subunit HisH [Christensenellales bacterium]|jgi:glutamine amidotransferase
MIAIVDYGVGNLFSLRASLSHLGFSCAVTGDKTDLEQAEKLILPGVGAFGDAAQKLKDAGLFTFLREQAAKGKPMLGICLGMQLLFEKSCEYGEHEGLSLIPGAVCPLSADLPDGFKVPHMGWNGLNIVTDDPLLKHVKPGAHMYFVHSYYAKGCEDALLAEVDYAVRVPALVRRGSVYGAQFHPEKSGPEGLSILKAFGELPC